MADIVQHYSGPAWQGGKNRLTKVSTAITRGRPCATDADGYITHVVSGTTLRPFYLAMETKASSVATTAPIQLMKPGEEDLFIFQATTEAVQADVGTLCDFGSDGICVIATSTNDDVQIIAPYDATHFIGKFNQYLS